MRFFLSIFILLFSAPAFAQSEALPDVPDPIQNLASEGAQLRYLGKDHGLDAWVAIKNGQEQYFYVMPDGKAFVMGILFDEKGDLVTVKQVQRLREQDDGMLDMLADDFGFDPANMRGQDEATAFKTPSEQMFYDIENANWVPLGAPGAPVMYAFIDPQCPHCHAFINDIREQIKAGQVQLRMVMVGFREETRAQSAFLLATPNPQGRWFRHLEGDENAIPVRHEISQQGVQRNIAVMQSWKLNVTPLIVYRAKNGSIKIVRGRPKDPEALVNDLGAGS